MQQFVVPQFIEVEDKIFGPITTRQFLILLSAGLTIFVVYKYADFALFVTACVVVGGLALLFAFVKINGQLFHFFLLNIIQTIRRPGLRVWQKIYNKKELDYFRNRDANIEIEEIMVQKQIKRNHIRDLSLIVNTGGYYNPNEDL
ncbi:MAG: hypothetical protein COX81_03110 [Candidatus Magasanikbacteria bacterium CG_4_10_14_0_2_um_filter_37_12]|uniref:PrgI family protein n=1 Tax=Candidatus Magasanikbacteria bacterium CG_4_10_14_0_2_um_filter_37_12 TaxID=1974637 RepID=A0A2M7V7B0_9BACT|nr:MAG: hypothetical protein COX81_03110 [Candidatus Magasanikbacteria bacterium CG_4_10_14_0_2_um_filter_37_12]